LCCRIKLFCSVFFFQAEDGIRDFHVTGVQTCALPIFMFFAFITIFFWAIFEQAPNSLTIFARDYTQRVLEGNSALVFKIVNSLRSEERRVGKECRSRWW